jgi:hypothetical protein
VNDIIPNPNGTCQVDWCERPFDHDGNHLSYVGHVEPSPWSPVKAVVVTVEAGRNETEALPVVTLVSHDGERVSRLSARLTWREAGDLAGLLDRSTGAQPNVREQVAAAAVTTAHSHKQWQHALLRLGASGALEATGTAIVVEHDTVEETLRIHAPERTDVDRVREIVRVAAVRLGIV